MTGRLFGRAASLGDRRPLWGSREFNVEAVNAQTRRVQLAILVVEPLAVGPKRNARTLVQFRLRSLLWVTTLAALMFAVSQTWMHSFPVGYVVVALLSIPISIMGFAMLVISGFLAFSIWITPAEDFHRRENLNSCFRMFVAGVATIVPFLYILMSFLINAPF